MMMRSLSTRPSAAERGRSSHWGQRVGHESLSVRTEAGYRSRGAARKRDHLTIIDHGGGYQEAGCPPGRCRRLLCGWAAVSGNRIDANVASATGRDELPEGTTNPQSTMLPPTWAQGDMP